MSRRSVFARSNNLCTIYLSRRAKAARAFAGELRRRLRRAHSPNLAKEACYRLPDPPAALQLGYNCERHDPTSNSRFAVFGVRWLHMLRQTESLRGRIDRMRSFLAYWAAQ
jgi:hypothetical protein